MQFNFGDQPFKHGPEPGFVGFSSAKDEDLVPNKKKGPGAVAERKIVKNAPQALIIEVPFFFNTRGWRLFVEQPWPNNNELAGSFLCPSS